MTSNNSYSQIKSVKDYGVISIMYHRFDENKYPSTNIRIEDFKLHINLIKKSGFKFISHKEFEESINKENVSKKILLTVDDGFSSFYKKAWPILKKNKIPFIIFISTEAVGKKGYMNWEQIKEIERYEFVSIGNHSHSHDYLINFSFNDFKKDITKSIELFKNNIGYNPLFFSYPFGEWDQQQKKFISENFEFAFGQHSGVIDMNKDQHELPRFPINEKYGDLKRFKFIIDLLPLQYKKILIEGIQEKRNPPKMSVEFFKDQKIDNINCFSNEGDGWDKSQIKINNNNLEVFFRDKFFTRRGRINCSINDNEGWRWFGVQFVLKNIKDN